MDTINPYQSPHGDTLEDTVSKNRIQQPVFDTRWQATRAGIWRGAVLGMRTISIIMTLIMGLGLLGILFGWIPRNEIPDSWILFCFQSVLMILAAGFLYGAIPGGIILGLIEMIRFRKPK